MKRWPTKPLGEICVVDWGNTNLTKSAYVEGGRYLAVSAAGCDGRIDHSEHTKHTPVLSAIGAQCGRMFLPEEDFTAIKNTITLTPREGVCTGKFLYQLLTYVELPKRGAAQPFISKGDIQTFQVPVPPLAEQQRIVSLLDEADTLRKLRARADYRAAALIPALFHEMFGDPTTNSKGWPITTLGELLQNAEVFVDGDWIESKDQDQNGEVRLIQLADIGDGEYLNKSSRFLTKETAVRLKCTRLEVGDVLVARMPDPLGRACIFPGDSKECITVVDVCIIRPGEIGLNPQWLVGCINSSEFRDLIARYTTGTTRQRISRGNLAKLPIPRPPLSIQKEFAQRATEIRELESGQATSRTRLDALFQSMLHRAFNGEL